MKKIIIVIILAILFLINIVAAAVIFIDIQVFKFPTTTIQIDIVEINSGEIILRHDLQIYNPNSFEMILKNFQIITTTPQGEEVARINITGGSIPGQSNQSYTASDRIVMKGNLSGLLTSTVTGVVGINFLGIITKTIPLEVKVLTSLKEALSKIKVPSITAHAEFGNITRDDISLTAEIDVENPNTVDIIVGDITVNITTETGKKVGNFKLSGVLIPAEQSVTLKGSGRVLLESLNAKKLTMLLTTTAGGMIAGINKTLPLSVTIEIAIPDFRKYIPSDPPLELSIDIDLQRARGGLKGNMTLEVINPSKIPLEARNLVVDYYRVKNHQNYLIAVGPMGSGELVPEATTYFHGDIFLSYAKLFNRSAGGFFPDMVFAQLRADVSLSGVNLSIPVAIGSYIDLHMLRPNT
jgi:LEA14-like dessication related protein